MILVTGATGHIGNVLARALIARGERVRALILPGEDCRSIQDLDIETIPGDITQPVSLEKAMQGVRKVFHLAGIISILPGKNKLLRQVNVQGTLNVLQACWQSGIERLVYTSSIHALARVPNGQTIDESIPFDPANPYGEYDRSKAEASLAVLQAARQGFDAVIVCPTGVIGPYDYRRSEMGQLILDCVEEKPQLYVDGAYDFVDVRDVAEGLLLADEKGSSGETYILSGEQISVEGLIGAVQKTIGRQLFKLRIPMSLAHYISHLAPAYYRLSHTRPRLTNYSLEVLESNSIISHAKAQSKLGYSPRSLLVTLSDTVHWFKENRHLL
jgi:dihydroflavonol-4-reductase